MTYRKADGKTRDQLEFELREVHAAYPEHSARPFGEMVNLFAEDDFYHLHYVAQRFKDLSR